jgi:hypothetical protein
VVFNLLFHFFVGFEPFLYSADWTYALVLFCALGFIRVADSKWLAAVALILLAALTLNNLTFLSFLMRGIAPYIPGV